MAKCIFCGLTTQLEWCDFMQQSYQRCSRCNRWSGSDEQEFKDYIQNQKTIGEVWSTQERLRNYLDKEFRQVYKCDNCKYINYHRIIYCPSCPSILQEEEISYADLRGKYKDYKSGS